MDEKTNALDTQIGGTHYQSSFQPITLITAQNLDFAQGNIIKYITRYKRKNGKEDLMKAIHYCDLALENNVSNPNYRGLSSSALLTYCEANDLTLVYEYVGLQAAIRSDYLLARRCIESLLAGYTTT